MKTLTPLEFWSLMAATVFNLYTYPALVAAATIGVVILIAAVVLLALVFRSEAMARKVGAFTYVIWRRKEGWMRDTPPPGSVAAELQVSTGEASAAQVGVELA